MSAFDTEPAACPGDVACMCCDEATLALWYSEEDASNDLQDALDWAADLDETDPVEAAVLLAVRMAAHRPRQYAAFVLAPR